MEDKNIRVEEKPKVEYNVKAIAIIVISIVAVLGVLYVILIAIPEYQAKQREKEMVKAIVESGVFEDMQEITDSYSDFTDDLQEQIKKDQENYNK